MQSQKLRTAVAWGIPLLVLLYLLYSRPGLFTSPFMVGGLILFEIVLASLWHYESVFLPLLMFCFVWAGSEIPFWQAGMSSRWLVLGVGALAGVPLWIRNHGQSFSTLHLAAFFCAMAAVVSAVVSNDPLISLLKASSLILMFLYCSTGLRLVLVGRETEFIRGLLRVCEGIVFGTALCYAVGIGFWQNPNSLGAVMGVVMLPIMVWGFFVADTRSEKYRSLAAILVCVILLYVSLSRASILAAAVSVVTLCVCLRKQRVLIEGAFLVVLVLAVAAVIQPEHFERSVDTFTGAVLYKGKKETGILGSRKSPWQEAITSMKQHPIFGTGFGTSDLTPKGEAGRLSLEGGLYTKEGTNRENGNSYLALAQYVGIFGLLPFSFLLFLVVRLIVRVCAYMRRTSNPRHCAIPLGMFLLGGLVHALFEDWLVAVGYYICMFFWISVFLVNDLMPEARPLRLPTASPAHPDVSGRIPDFAAARR